MNPLLVLLLLAILGGAVAPPLVDVAYGDSIQPDNPAYTIEKLGEQIRLWLAQYGVGNYTQLLEQVLEERLTETEYCIEHNCTDKIPSLLDDYNNTMSLLVQHLLKHNKTQLLNQIKLKLQQHKQRIQHILETQITTGMSEVQISIENTISSINEAIHEIEIHIEK